MRFIFRNSLLALAIVAIASSQNVLAAGSNTSGGLKGQVLGENSQPIDSAVVTIINKNTGASRVVTADSDGSFRAGNLPVGTYDIRIQQSGYQDKLLENIIVSLGGDTAVEVPLTSGSLEEIVVTGKQFVVIDTASTVGGLNITAEDLSKIPVPRTVNSVALLAPGAAEGDASFNAGSSNQGLISSSMTSFGGSSVAENVFYINGLNVTNFRNGLGGSTVPFEFYEEFQVKTGGYSAEFGRSTGGVVNAVTKHGSNEFHYGIVTSVTPDFLRDTSPDTRKRDGSYYDYNSDNGGTSGTVDLYASGPIIKDKLFFYALVEPRKVESNYASLGSPDKYNEQESDDAFWGATIDWNIVDNHMLTITAFSDEREVTTSQYDYIPYLEDKGAYIGKSTDERGGDNVSILYTGQITNDLSVSAMWGKNEYSLTSLSSNDTDCPLVVDVRSSASSSRPGCEVNTLVDTGMDEREAMRLDFEWYLGDHNIRFGVDREVNTSEASSIYTGDNRYYRYVDVTPGTALSNGGIVPAGVTQAVRYREHSNGGSFETTSQAFYIEDTWQIVDSVVAKIGIRNEKFENLNSLGEPFIDIDNQWAPRVGVIWDVFNDGGSKLYANWGRYHLPIANNTNVRLAGAELDFHTWYEFDGILDPVTAAPILLADGRTPAGAEIGTLAYTSDGEVPDVREVLDSSIDPMYQDEFILGFESLVGDDWKAGVRYIRRDLSSTIEDVIINHAADKYGYADPGHDIYILTNPGSDVKTYYDTDGNGTLEPITLSAADLEYPKAKRKYRAIEFTFERLWDGEWLMKGSYTWARSTGNAEGSVKSDNGQDDAGILQDFDFPALMDGAEGYLPNDRRHMLKLFGAYQVTEGFQLGLNFLLQSGRPINAFGTGHPDYGPGGAAPYGDTYYLWDDTNSQWNKIPRGKMGRTDWLTRFDLSAIYSTQFNNMEVELRADIFNLFNAAATTEVYEFAETSPGSEDALYGLTQRYQAPRSVRLGASVRF